MFIAGPYAALYGRTQPINLGVIEEGFELEWTGSYELIRGDNLGDVVQDRLLRGLECFVSFVGEHFDTVRAAKLLWPWEGQTSTAGNIQVGDLPYIPQLDPSQSDEALLQLIPLNQTQASVALPYIVAQRAVFPDNFPLRLILNSRLRKFPYRWRLMPYIRTASQLCFFQYNENGALPSL